MPSPLALILVCCFVVPALGQDRCYRIEGRYTLQNKSERRAKRVRVYLPVPTNGPTQKVSDLKWQRDGRPWRPRFHKDQFGQRVAIFDLGELAAGQETVCGFRCRADLAKRRRVRLKPESSAKVWALPADVQKHYVGDVRGVLDLDDKAIQARANDICEAAGNKLDLVSKTYAFVAKSLTYKLEKGWDSASVVLQRKNGSCSEFSYLFSALCRANGIPTRFVGATMLRSGEAAPFVDRVWHRWVQVYLPKHGWVHMDPTRDRKQARRKKPKLRHFGKQPGPSLILSYHGGRSVYLGNHYVGADNQRRKHVRRKIRFYWTPLPTAAKAPPTSRPSPKRAPRR